MSASVTVVALGCELDRLFSGQRPALPVPGPPERDDLRDLFEAVAGPLRNDEAVIVTIGDWLPPETLERVHTIRSLLQTDRVSIHVTDLPPLAASVQAALTAALAPYAPSAGALAGALEQIGQELLVLAWVGSVAGLRHPAVSMTDHARSALPWTAFGVGMQPESFVRPLTRRHDEFPLVRPGHPVELLVAPTHNGELDWVVEFVVPALGDVPVREIPATMYGSEWWGTSRLVEVVGVPTDLESFARVTLPMSVTPCSWCGEPIGAPPCPFCGDAGPGAVPPRGQEHSRAGTLATRGSSD